MFLSLVFLLAALDVVVSDPHYIVDTKCPDKPADIVFVLDGSGSEGHANFQKELDFIKNFTEEFNIGRAATQVSVVQFGTSVRNEFNLKDHTSSHSLETAISNIRWINGETYTGDALNYVDRNSFTAANGGRNNVDKMVIVLTDGQSNHPNETVFAAKKLHDRRFTVVAIGIGNNVNGDELKAIASNSKHVFTVPNFSALGGIHKDLTTTACKLCDSTPIDLAFLLDGSGSEGSRNFYNERGFAKLVVGELNFNGDGTHIAMVTFSTTAHRNFAFTDRQTESNINQLIDKVRYPNGESNTHLGLQYLTDNIFSTSQARYGSKHIAVVITDGKSNEENLTKMQATRLKSKSVLVIAVGIGNEVDPVELKTIASGDQYILRVNSSALLDAIHDKVVDLLCEAKSIYTTTPKPTTTTTTPKPTKPPTTTPAPIECGPKPADILFLLDNSDSEGAENFAKELAFVSNFANRLVIDPKHNQISALSIASTAKNEFWFNTYKNRHDVVNAILNIPYIGAGTNTAAAFVMARTQSFAKSHGSRDSATKIAIIVTDGRSVNETLTLKAASDLKQTGVTVVSIGVGFGQDDHELRSMASSSKYVFSVENFDALRTIQRQVFETTCQQQGVIVTTSKPTSSHQHHG